MGFLSKLKPSTTRSSSASSAESDKGAKKTWTKPLSTREEMERQGYKLPPRAPATASPPPTAA